MTKLLLLVGAALSICTTPAFSNQIIGLPANTNNRYPFGCAYSSLGSGQYQQVYAAAAFSGPITISHLEFYNTEIDTGATSMNSGNWTIVLSITSANWNTLSANFASNIGADNTTVFSGNLFQPLPTAALSLSTPTRAIRSLAACSTILIQVPPVAYSHKAVMGWSLVSAPFPSPPRWPCPRSAALASA